MRKECGRCGETKPVEGFHRFRQGGYQAWCKPCRRTYDAAYHRANKARLAELKKKRRREVREWFRSLKEGRPCADCGGTFHPAAMQWDHLPGTIKAADLSNLGKRGSPRRVIEEIAKCELVCANCHAVRTVRRRGA
jgi:hypothetical protein